MNDRNHSLDQEQALAAERAAEWLRQLEQSERNKEQFVKWLSRSPENVGEVLTAATTDIVLKQLMAEKKFDAEQFVAAAAHVPSIGDAVSREPMKRRTRLQLIAASVGLSLAAGIAAFFFAPTLVHDWLHPNEYTTSIGELRTVNLADGSIVAINAQSSVRVALSEHWRDLYLDKGQAIFTVAKDRTRPFRVHVIATGENGELKDTIIQAVGTKFDVRRNDDGVNVAVVEGVVQIESDGFTSVLDESMKKIGEAAKVTAGQAVAISYKSAGIVAPPVQINVASVGMWQQRRLVFIDARLEDIVKEFERYNRSPRILVEGDALKDRRFSGVFDADYPEQQLIGYFSSQEGNTVSLDREGDDLIIRLRADADQSREE